MSVQQEETGELDKPPSTKVHHNGRPAEPWRTAILANLQADVTPGPDDPPDAGAEFDRRETVDAIAEASKPRATGSPSSPLTTPCPSR